VKSSEPTALGADCSEPTAWQLLASAIDYPHPDSSIVRFPRGPGFETTRAEEQNVHPALVHILSVR